MEYLNYHHLHYFWSVAKEGSIARASEKLQLAPPTISAQIKALEDALGEQLFHRRGRSLVLTETGQLVYGYADDIFNLGRELVQAVKGRPTGSPTKLTVGVADAVPKLVVRRVLKPTMDSPEPVHLVVKEGKLEHLLSDLATYRYDLVLADAPAPSTVKVKVFNHLLGECGTTIVAPPALAVKLRLGFPGSLHQTPAMLPTEGTSMRRALERWFDALGIRPRIVAEFDDSALMKAFADEGAGWFPVPSVVAEEVCRQFNVEAVGVTPQVQERYYAISGERKLKHPAVLAITEAARLNLFTGLASSGTVATTPTPPVTPPKLQPNAAANKAAAAGQVQAQSRSAVKGTLATRR